MPRLRDHVVCDSHVSKCVCTGMRPTPTSAPLLVSDPPLMMAVVNPVDGAGDACSTSPVVFLLYKVNSPWPRPCRNCRSKPPSVSFVTSGLTLGRPIVADGRMPTMPFSGTCVRNVYLKFTGTRLPA